ncbi:sigma-E factor negative regulatory protein [Massilia sp. IC2-476]|uniref:sigma-E factor negative regulatory protein n=1 Tax=Massilia sp. IC2-476 TaxID=2887199 RepID=UPI001D11B24A|nr:sigma-E factor negative regulatory protein [Massilia sp. IC2-476]MCC2973564.1 sigma-E factor negative regulatory protein [Massilia sp. IC2-476]
MNTPTAAGYQMDTNKKIREYISAFADGELPEADLELALAALREADGRQAWDLYHQIGDALRGEPGHAELSPDFRARLADKLAAEPMPLRRAAARPSTPADTLAAIAPSVVAAGEALNGSKLAEDTAASHDAPAPESSPAVAKRL